MPELRSGRNRTAWLLWAVCGCLFHFQTAAVGGPNLLLIVTDDQRPDTIHALGNERIRTPHLDRLVARGMAFSRAITAIPICVASRAELLTGQNARLNGNNDFGFSPRKNIPHLASTLKQGGYDTCYVGKWHTPGRPSDSGYEHAVGLYGSGGGRLPLTFPLDWKGQAVTGYRGWVFQTDARQIFPEKGVGLTPDISAEFASAAIEFLNQPRTQPFFLHVNFTAPHDPLLLPTGYEDRYDADEIPLPANFAPAHPFDHGNAGGRDEVLFQTPRTPEETKRGLAVYYAVIEHLDQQVGRILKALEDSGELENTVVLFTSDHGLAMGSHGLRGKQNMYEHTVNVPFVVAGPGIPMGARSACQCYLRDIFPTLCDFAEISIPPSVHGKSLRPVLRGDTSELYEAVFANFRDSQEMIRTNDGWKLVLYPQAQREQLFHVTADPFEVNNLAQDPAQQPRLKELRNRLQAHIRQREL